MSIVLDGKCLCYHGPLLYEAKVLRVFDEKNQTLTSKEYTDLSVDDESAELDRPPEHMRQGQCFYVHYQGWKSSWDEWVGLDRIRPYNEENLALKKSLVEKARESKNSAAKKKTGARPVGRPSKKEKERAKKATGLSSGDAAASGSTSTSTSNSNANSNASSNPASASSASSTTAAPDSKADRKKAASVLNKRTHPKIHIKVPISLRSVLVDDWENVTKDRKLVELPSERPIEHILSQFYAETSNSMPSAVDQSQLSEFLHGVKLYFNLSLGKLLLYRLERIQYAQLLKTHPEKQYTELYGVIHLLRLVTLLPEMIESSNVDDQTAKILVKYCDILLEWIAINVATKNYPIDPYINTSSQYEGVALS
ncbi:unnamed protein product [Kluyveromyces dobzhanskii CBS 2104]|uniref:Chromatin modification-related protein EAF3 n=1 Tax=Kluyveromyces dobzhanskii CBS 2104 TaxID=1427455 RepID=A0A0A8L352_9SACH|nr:unnamed protein product [Kluyveromyces dobzhanskii CBS 2104]